MSSGRGVVFAGAALLLATGALVTMAITLDEQRPVEARRVEVGPAVPGVLSATFTTTIEVARVTTPVVVVPPAPRPPAPVTTTTTAAVVTTTTVEPPPLPSSSVPESTTSSAPRPPWAENCDPSYVTDGPCVPWRFPREVQRRCDWLRDQGTTRIEVQGWDRHHLDLDHDGIACERSD